MLILFSPYSFIFVLCYFIFILSLFMIDNFFYYWRVIEILILLFIGISYTIFVRSYSQLIVYFLIQALSSFLILIFYIYDYSILLTLRFFIKLSMFPFFTWYINLIYRFPNFIFWIARTLHKIPAILMIKIFSLSLNLNLLWGSIIFTVLLRGVIILSIVDFRIILVLSSIGNNSWFLLRQMSNIFIFLFFILIYRISLYCVLRVFNNLSKFNFIRNSFDTSYKLSFWVLSLSGIPPFPLFYGKILVILRFVLALNFNYYFFIFLIFNALIVIGYLQSIIKFFIFVYSSLSHYLIKY
jgi:hypothetical protein